MKSFIYCFRSRASSLVYVGQTVRPLVREQQHRCMLRGGTHRNRFLIEEYRKHGDCFTFEILEECSTFDAYLLEQAWINKLAKSKDVANLRPAAPSARLGQKHSTETKQKMSRTHKKQGRQPWHQLTTQRSLKMNALHKPQSEVAKKRRSDAAYAGIAERVRRPVVNIDTGFTYYSGREAAKQLGVHTSSVHDACRGKLARLKGHRWRYLNEIKH